MLRPAMEETAASAAGVRETRGLRPVRPPRPAGPTDAARETAALRGAILEARLDPRTTLSRHPLPLPALRWPGPGSRRSIARDPCDPSSFHTRPLSSTHVVYYADACSLFVRDEKGKVAHEFPGKEGTRWAFSHGGRFVCRWQPGERATVFTLPQGLEFPLSWRIPDFTSALAIGKDRIVVRENGFTAMFRFDGTPVGTANLPAWEEGVFVEDRLVLTRQTGTRALWVVRADGLDFLWSCHDEEEGFIIR
jgi:hypothetical protein